MTDLYDADEAPQEDWDGFGEALTDLEDESLHPVHLVKMERKPLPSSYPDAAGYDPETRTAPAIIWTFSVDDADGYEINGTSSDALGPKSKFRKWASALIGKDAATRLLQKREGETSNDYSGRIKSGLIGTSAQAEVRIKENGYPKVEAVHRSQSANAPRRAAEAPEPVTSTTPPPGEAPEPSDELGF